MFLKAKFYSNNDASDLPVSGSSTQEKTSDLISPDQLDVKSCPCSKVLQNGPLLLLRIDDCIYHILCPGVTVALAAVPRLPATRDFFVEETDDDGLTLTVLTGTSTATNVPYHYLCGPDKRITKYFCNSYKMCQSVT